MGRASLQNALTAIILAFLLLDFYIALSFRKIGGMAAGLFAIVALLHDVAMVYFTFIFFRIPLDDNFIAVVLTILGYSLNDTIVIYDRIRENRRLMGLKAGYGALGGYQYQPDIDPLALHRGNGALCLLPRCLSLVRFYGTFQHSTFALPMMVGVDQRLLFLHLHRRTALRHVGKAQGQDAYGRKTHRRRWKANLLQLPHLKWSLPTGRLPS